MTSELERSQPPAEGFDPVRWLIAPWTVAVWFPLVLAATAFFGIAAILLAGVSRHAAFLTGVGWARILCWASFVRVRVAGRQRAAPGTSYVIVANHQGNFDILALYGFLGLPFRWVMKQELRRVPILGWACERIGHIYVDRSDSHAAIASLDAAKPRLAGGVSAVFFPEGTRSPDGRLLPFKKGAFRFARQLELPLLPVSIRGSRRVLPKGSIFPRPGTLEVRFHEPIPNAPGRPLEETLEAARRALAPAVE
jgi:1-acyl-sn-glycerol-3-phosphate acyltransferase